mmetsp:Transcript_27340/g.78546  ORF Transcript_27340/g.78546 Transcript_27340/m.78546 type:complete len:306 (+) Transcript_27340:180-1097(+)
MQSHDNSSKRPPKKGDGPPDAPKSGIITAHLAETLLARWRWERAGQLSTPLVPMREAASAPSQTPYASGSKRRALTAPRPAGFTASSSMSLSTNAMDSLRFLSPWIWQSGVSSLPPGALQTLCCTSSSLAGTSVRFLLDTSRTLALRSSAATPLSISMRSFRLLPTLALSTWSWNCRAWRSMFVATPRILMRPCTTTSRPMLLLPAAASSMAKKASASLTSMPRISKKCRKRGFPMAPWNSSTERKPSCSRSMVSKRAFRTLTSATSSRRFSSSCWSRSGCARDMTFSMKRLETMFQAAMKKNMM